VVVGVAVGALTVGLVVADATTSRSGDTVAMVGDSITHVNQGAIEAALGSTFHSTVAAESGKRTDQMMQAAQELAATHPKQALINLGTNDVEQGTSVDAAAQNLARMVSMFSSADCVHVVTINTHMLSADGHSPERAAALNAKILELPKQFKNVDLVRWDQTIDQNVDSHPPAGDLTSDTVHPNEKGVEDLVGEYRGAFEGCQRSWVFW
jgi:lysophospholipase L1-like esterase